MQEYLDQINKELRFRNYSQKTIDSYQICIKYFLQFLKNDISKISKENIYDFIFYLQDQKKAPKTINLYKEAIKFFLKEILKIQVDIDIKLSKEPNKLPIVLSKNEIEKIISNTANTKHKLIISLSYSSGLRVSEIKNLKIGDIDLENLTIHLKGSKGQKNRLTVFSEKLKNEIIKFSAGKKGNDYLVESERGGNLSERTIQQVFKNALKKSEIKKDASFHSLRHSFATHLLESGVDIRYIQKLLGHKTIRTTQVYTKVMNPSIKNIKSPF